MAQPVGFPILCGHPSIDLVNTEIVRRGVRHDLLLTESDLERWLVVINRETSFALSQKPTFSVDILQGVKKLRAYLRSGFEQLADGHTLGDNWSEPLEEFTRKAPLSYRLVEGALVPTPMGDPASGLLSLIALNTLELLASGKLARIRRCANPECVLLFTDSNGRRKWCSMKICGNRAKVSRHQSKHTK